MFTKSQAFYDAVYSFKDYPGEADWVAHTILERNSNAKTILDVCCGTGMHLFEMQKFFGEFTGVDLDEGMLQVAKSRVPNAQFCHGDMRQLNLSEKYDAVVCLFSSIGYCLNANELNATVQRLADHLNKNGVLLIEPWIERDQYMPGHLHAVFVDRTDLKISRMSLSERTDDTCVHHFHYMVGTPEGIEAFEERHEMGLFSAPEYQAALEKAGLDWEFDPEGLIGRGMYIAQKN